MADEVASDVMMKLWRIRNKIDVIENIKVYAFVMARNMSLNLIKSLSKNKTLSLEEIEVELIADSYSPEQILITEDLRKRLDEVIQELPNRNKLVYKLVKEDGLSYKETAEILGISSKTVDAHLVAAVKKITSILKLEFNLD